jgi:hypothetical protein
LHFSGSNFKLSGIELIKEGLDKTIIKTQELVPGQFIHRRKTNEI